MTDENSADRGGKRSLKAGAGSAAAHLLMLAIATICLNSDEINGTLAKALGGGGGGKPMVVFSPFDYDGIPPGFEKVLPAEVLKKLQQLHHRTLASFKENQAAFDRIMSTVPGETLAKLPMPPGVDFLPSDEQSRFREFHADPRLNWAQRTDRFRSFVDALPEPLRMMVLPAQPLPLDPHDLHPGGGHPLLPSPPPPYPPVPPPPMGSSPCAPPFFPPPPPMMTIMPDYLPMPMPPPSVAATSFPPLPPPGFEKILPDDVYGRLVKVHQNDSLSLGEKRQKIEEVMLTVPAEVLDRLPLPPTLDLLSTEKRGEAKRILTDKTITSYKQRDRKMFEFVLNLEPRFRRVMFPPMPPNVFFQLPFESQRRIMKLLADEQLMGRAQVEPKFWALVDELPTGEKEAIEKALKQN